MTKLKCQLQQVNQDSYHNFVEVVLNTIDRNKTDPNKIRNYLMVNEALDPEYGKTRTSSQREVHYTGTCYPLFIGLLLHWVYRLI